MLHKKKTVTNSENGINSVTLCNNDDDDSGGGGDGKEYTHPRAHAHRKATLSALAHGLAVGPYYKQPKHSIIPITNHCRA